jgi:hypothetical protein
LLLDSVPSDTVFGGRRDPQSNGHAANGFDLHAGLVVPAGQRNRLERLCRYALRPPVMQERLHLTDEGQVRLQFRQPWRDGTTDVVFDPVEFLERLAVLVPRPRINLILYHGVLGPRAAWRADVVRRQTSEDGRDASVQEPAPSQAGERDLADAARRRARGQCWASLMQRTFGFDVLACPRCGGHLRLIALIEEAAVIGRILRHLGVPTEIPAPRPARAPPFSAVVPDAAGGAGLRTRYSVNLPGALILILPIILPEGGLPAGRLDHTHLPVVPTWGQIL